MVDLGAAVIAVLLFAALLPLLVLPWIHRQYARYGRLRGWAAVVAAAETLYLCGLVAFTLFPLPDETAEFCAGRTTADYLVLNPLNDLAGPAQLILNVILFVPLGFLLRYRFRRRLLAATVIGFGVSLLVETVQGTAVFGLFACPYRVADTGDLITNTVGAVAGWVAATLIQLPELQPARSPDLEPPGLLRRGLAVGADLLIAFFAASTIRIVLVLTGAEGLADNRAVTVVLTLATYAVTALLIPLRRADHATLGQATFFLAPDVSSGAKAVWPRFLVWWLPVALLQATDHLTWIFLAAVVLGVLAVRRPDRRTPLDRLTGGTTVTRDERDRVG